MLGGGLIGYVKSKPLGNGQIISIDVLVFVMIIAVFHKKLLIGGRKCWLMEKLLI